MAGQAGPPGPGGLLAVPGLGSADVDSDEEVIGIRPKSSPLPRRRSSASEDDFDPDPPLSGSRRVSFADAKGLSLVHVKEFALWDVPEPSEGQESEEYFLSPLTFSLPPPEELVTKVQEQKVELETIEVLPGTTVLRGVVCVLNISFTKAVYIRATLDCWCSHFDLLADYIPGSSEGPLDRFAFKLTLVPPFVDHRARVDFCVRYETPVGTFWANNDSRNYVLFCQRRRREQRPQREKRSCLKSNSQSFTSTENTSDPEPSSLEPASAGAPTVEAEPVNEAQATEGRLSWPGEEAQKPQTDSRRNSRHSSRRKAARMARVREHSARRTESDLLTGRLETSGMSGEQPSQVAPDSMLPDQADAAQSAGPSVAESPAEERSAQNADAGGDVTFGTVVAPLYRQVFLMQPSDPESDHVMDLSCTSAHDAGTHGFSLNSEFGNPFESPPLQGQNDHVTCDPTPESHERTPQLDKHPSGTAHHVLAGPEDATVTADFRPSPSTEDDSDHGSGPQKLAEEPSDEESVSSQERTEEPRQTQASLETSPIASSAEPGTAGEFTLGSEALQRSGPAVEDAAAPLGGALDVRIDIRVEDISTCFCKREEDNPQWGEGGWIKTCDENSHVDIKDSLVPEEEPAEVKDWEMMVAEEEESVLVTNGRESEEMGDVEKTPVEVSVVGGEPSPGFISEEEDVAGGELAMKKDSEEKTATLEAVEKLIYEDNGASEERSTRGTQVTNNMIRAETGTGAATGISRDEAVTVGDQADPGEILQVQYTAGESGATGGEKMGLDTQLEVKEAETIHLLKVEQDLVEHLGLLVKDGDEKMATEKEGEAEVRSRREEQAQEMMEKEEFESLMDGESFEIKAMVDPEDLKHVLTGIVLDTTDQIHNATLEEHHLERAAAETRVPQVEIRKTISAEDEGAATEEQESKVKPEPSTQTPDTLVDAQEMSPRDEEEAVKQEDSSLEPRVTTEEEGPAKREDQQQSHQRGSPRVRTRKSSVPELKPEPDVESKLQKEQVIRSTPEGRPSSAVDERHVGVTDDGMKIGEEGGTPEVVKVTELAHESEEKLAEEIPGVRSRKTKLANKVVNSVAPVQKEEAEKSKPSQKESGREESPRTRTMRDISEVDPGHEPEDQPGEVEDGRRPSAITSNHEDRKHRRKVEEQTREGILWTDVTERKQHFDGTPRVKARRAKVTKDAGHMQRLVPDNQRSEESLELGATGEVGEGEGKHLTDTRSAGNDDTQQVKLPEQNSAAMLEHQVKTPEDNMKSTFERKAEKRFEETPGTKARMVEDPEQPTLEGLVSGLKRPGAQVGEETHMDILQESEVNISNQEGPERNKAQEIGPGGNSEHNEVMAGDRIIPDPGVKADNMSASSREEPPRIKARRSKTTKKKHSVDQTHESEPGVAEEGPEVRGGAEQGDVEIKEQEGRRATGNTGRTKMADKMENSLVQHQLERKGVIQSDPGENTATLDASRDATWAVEGPNTMDLRSAEMMEQQQSSHGVTEKPGVHIRRIEVIDRPEPSERRNPETEVEKVAREEGREAVPEDRSPEGLDAETFFTAAPRGSEKSRQDLCQGEEDKHLGDFPKQEQRLGSGIVTEELVVKMDPEKEVQKAPGVGKTLELVVTAVEDETKVRAEMEEKLWTTVLSHSDRRQPDSEEMTLDPATLQDQLKPEVKVTGGSREVKLLVEKPRIKTRRTKTIRDVCPTDKVLSAAQERPAPGGGSSEMDRQTTVTLESKLQGQLGNLLNGSSPSKPTAEERVMREPEEEHTRSDVHLDLTQRNMAEVETGTEPPADQSLTEVVVNSETPRVKFRRSKMVHKSVNEIQPYQEDHQETEVSAGGGRPQGSESTDEEKTLQPVDKKAAEETLRSRLKKLDEGFTGTPGGNEEAGGMEEDGFRSEESRVQKTPERLDALTETAGRPAQMEVHESEESSVGGFLTEDQERLPSDEEWVESEDSNSAESDSDDEVELYMHCLRVAHTAAIKDPSRDAGPSKRLSVRRSKLTSMPVISESLDEEQNPACSQDQLGGTSAAEEPPACGGQRVLGWRETFCSNISRGLLYATLLGVFVTVAQRYDFLACLGLYLVSVVWLLCRREKQEKNDGI